jgi:RNA polymerase sigma-70 factor (ECF subfamily)
MTPSALRNQALSRPVQRNHTGQGADEEDGTPGETGAAEARRLAASDRDAFEGLFRRMSEPLFRFVAGMTGDETEARDVVQDIFARLWSARAELAEVRSLPAYLFRMARNEVYDRQREAEARRERVSRLHQGDRGSEPDSPEESLDALRLRELLDRWISDLPERQREALLLSRRDELTHEEVAEVMGISPNTVNNHVVRALERLRRRARDERPDLLR